MTQVELYVYKIGYFDVRSKKVKRYIVAASASAAIQEFGKVARDSRPPAPGLSAYNESRDLLSVARLGPVWIAR